MNQFCERQFYNGPAIMFGKSLLDLAAMQAESSQKFHGSDRELKQNPEIWVDRHIDHSITLDVPT